MALQVVELTRVFHYNGAELLDPSPKMSADEVKETYSAAYAELLNATVEGPVVKDGKAIFTFFKAAGGKG